MEQLTILVKGSSAEPYETTFLKDGDSLTVICTCPAGTYGNLCKHRRTILTGDAGAVLDAYSEKVATVVEWLVGTDVEAALKELCDIEAAADSTKDSLVSAKRKLARAMNS